MANGLTQRNRPWSLATPLGEDLLVLRRFEGIEELGRLSQFNLDLLSDEHDVDFDQIIGQNVTISLKVSNDQIRYFNGFVSEFIQLPSERGYAHYRAVVVPWLWFLTRSADCRLFQKMKVPDILAKVFAAHKFNSSFDRQHLAPAYTPWEYCVQYRETAFNFVNRLMEQEGIYYFFDYKDGDHSLVLADSSKAHSAFPGYDEISYLPSSRGGETGEHIRDWSIHKRFVTGSYTHTDFNFTTPKTPLQRQAQINRAYARAGDFECFDCPGEYESPAEGKDWAKIRIEEVHARQLRYNGVADARGIAPGYTFVARNLPRDSLNGRTFLVCSAIYVGESDVFGAGGPATAPEFQCNFSAIDLQADPPQTYRSARITPKPIIQGAQTAIVVGPDHEEIHTDDDGHGRVKVRFHWDRVTRPDDPDYDSSSCWLRVAQLWAGTRWGTQFLPRIGQEVVVEFLEGDPDRPIVTGRVYNADQMPPYDLPANKTQSGIKTRSTKGGKPTNYNEIQFEDKKGAEKINIHAEKDLSVSVENDKSESVQGNKSVNVDGTHTETVKKDTTVNISEGKFKQNVLKSTAEYTIFSTIHLISQTQDIWIKAAKQILVDSNGVSTARFGEDGSIVIDGAASIKLQSGGSSIELKKDGTIKISGKKVEISGTDEAKLGTGNQTIATDVAKTTVSGAAITSSAIGEHEISGALIKIN